MKLPQPPLLSLIAGSLTAALLWASGADALEIVGVFACGVFYALFYLVVKPRRD